MTAELTEGNSAKVWRKNSPRKGNKSYKVPEERTSLLRDREKAR